MVETFGTSLNVSLVKESVAPALGCLYETLQLSLLTDTELGAKGRKLEASLRQLEKDEKILGPLLQRHHPEPNAHFDSARGSCSYLRAKRLKREVRKLRSRRLLLQVQVAPPRDLTPSCRAPILFQNLKAKPQTRKDQCGTDS